MKKLLTLLMLTAMSFGTITAVAQTTPATTQHLKKDGTPDKRYKGGKSATVAAATTGSAPSSSDMHIKADGAPDKRYKSNKSTSLPAPSAAPATVPATNGTPVSPAPTQSTAAAPTTARHLKKDGTPDMRYKENRTPGVDKNGTPDMRYKANKKKS